MSDTSQGEQGFGQMDPSNTSSQFNAIEFLIQQTLGRTRTMIIVQVKKVKNAEGGEATDDVEAVGFVDVQPMVNMLDGNGNSTPHGIVNNMPYTRIQGGKNAVIMTPKVGDIGWAAIADRDISAVKKSKEVSNPGSLREFNLADGVYLGGILNGVPENFVQFTSDDKIKVKAKSDISVESDTKIVLKAPDIALDGNVSATDGTINVTSDISTTKKITSSDAIEGATVKQGNIILGTHRHTSTTPGNPTSQPIP